LRKFEGYEKGVNLGGWISQFAKYDTNHFETFITKDDIDYIASLGFDHVRVPVDYNVLEDEEGNIIESGFGYLKNCQEWCAANNLKMLIDLHECYGYSFDPLKVDMDRKKFFYDDALQARFMKLWTTIANTFKDYQDMVAFEPLNEVVLEEVADKWNEIATKWIQMMREIVPDAYLIIGGVCYNSVLTVPLIDVPVDPKVIFNFHCYEPMIFTHQGAYWMDYQKPDFRIGYPLSLEEYRAAARDLCAEREKEIFPDSIEAVGPELFERIFAVAIEAAEKANVPLYCGEYGTIDLAANEDKLRWLTDIHSVFHKYGIGRALWNYKEKDFGFVDESFAEIREDFMKTL